MRVEMIGELDWHIRRTLLVRNRLNITSLCTRTHAPIVCICKCMVSIGQHFHSHWYVPLAMHTHRVCYKDGIMAIVRAGVPVVHARWWCRSKPYWRQPPSAF